jgi:hypothetical protein
MGHVACIVEMRNEYNILVGKPEGKRIFGRPRHRWENHIRLDLREVWWGGVDGCIWLRTGTSGRLL